MEKQKTKQIKGKLIGTASELTVSVRAKDENEITLGASDIHLAGNPDRENEITFFATAINLDSDIGLSYIIVQRESVIQLSGAVNRLRIESSYMPLGAPFCHKEFWYQAMIKEIK